MDRSVSTSTTTAIGALPAGASVTFTDGESEAAPSFSSVAASVIEASENPVGEAAPEPAPAGEPAAAAPEGTPAAGGGEAPTGEAGETPAAAEGGNEPRTDEVLNALADWKREDVPEDLLPIYDTVVEARKHMQADYTRKTMAVAEERKEVEAAQADLDARIQAGVQAQLVALGVPMQGQPQQGAPANADPMMRFWSPDMGEPVTIEQAMEAADPSLFQRYVSQQTTVAARAAAMDVFNQLVGPQLQQVTGTVQSQQERAADAYVEAFALANPELAANPDGLDTALRLVQSGLARDLDDAAPKAMQILFGEQRVAQAAQVGYQAAQTAAANVAANKEQYSVPSNSTVPKPAPGTGLKGLTFGQIGQKVVEGYENGE